MGQVNSVQRAIHTQLNDVYRVCANAESVDDLVEHIREPMATWLDIDVITIAFADEPAIVLGSIGHLTDEFMARIRRHAVRCIEGKGFSPRQADDIVIQHAGVPPCDDIVEPDGILWTGAIEFEGRLMAVVTFYRQASQQLSPLELAALRQVRGLISEAMNRVYLLSSDFCESHDLTFGDDVQSDVVTAQIDDADLIVKAFGDDRLKRVQQALIHRLSDTFPRAFMIARVGPSQVIVIAHSGDGMTLEQWRSNIDDACRTILIKEDVPLRISVELGEVQEIGHQTPSTATTMNPTNRPGDIQSPKNATIDVLAG